MILFKNFRENRIRHRFKNSVEKITKVFDSLEMENKPTLEFNYKLDKHTKYMGIFHDLSHKEKPNHIIINLTKIRNKKQVAIILCHELGHWHHYFYRREHMMSLKIIARDNRLQQNEAYYNAIASIENFADEYGKLFSKTFKCDFEYNNYVIYSKIDREELNMDYLDYKAYQQNMSKQTSKDVCLRKTKS